MELRGRKVIYTSKEQIDSTNIIPVLRGAFEQHKVNRNEIEYLLNYYKGKQPILDRKKEVRPEINTQLVENIPYALVRTINGYTYGEPIKYVQKEPTMAEDIHELNKLMECENKPSVDLEIANYKSICGTSYRYVAISEDLEECPFNITALDPRNTFVVYSTTPMSAPMLGCVYHDLVDDEGTFEGYRFQVYTVDGFYTIITEGEELTDDSSVTYQQHYYSDIPIVEYPNNHWRIGDFEPVITLIDAKNIVDSDRVNSMLQFVSSYLVFINCDLESAEESADGISDLQRFREQQAIVLQSTNERPADVKNVTETVDQNQIQILSDHLLDMIYSIVGVPDRKNRSGGGGDTGQAVQLRDGWADLETLARNKELYFKKSEKRFLKIILSILKLSGRLNVSVTEIECKFTRNKNDNFLVKTQGLQNLLACGVNRKEAYILSGLFNDPVESALEDVKTEQDKVEQQTGFGVDTVGLNKGEVTNGEQPSREQSSGEQPN